MKLKNKQTGEIIDKWPDDFVVNSGSQIYNYNSLADLCEEWEDYDLFVIDQNNKNTTPEQLRDCIKDALENIDQRLQKQEKLMEVMVSHLDTQAKINERLARVERLVPTEKIIKEKENIQCSKQNDV